MATEFIQGRGAQANVSNIFFKQHYSRDIVEGIDEWEEDKPQTQFTIVHPKSFVNKVDSPDVGMEYSANPYQGCEHGCIYCYARNSHQYWGYSAGLDFETKIMVKANSVKLFREFITRKSWTGTPISLSGNTDCYQPLERKFELTRGILKTASQYGQPISIITKNSLILRDADIISEMSNRNLCMVFISINSLTEDTRLKLEPRTVTAKQRLHVIESLSKLGVPVGIMCAPVIPGLTDHEIPKVLKAAANAGAKWAGYTTVRLNGEIGQIFEDWLHKAYPDRANKIWHSIQSCHHGKVNDSEFGNRMKGTGKQAQMIKDSFRMHCKRNKLNVEDFEFDCSHFLKNGDQQLKLF
ncbi:PA0069 family radical SAM protein [Sphingobacterium sp. DK4209]|uniref:PA0069 family radical SAM protein n=1 Tax=Sphingobacterium zhuxiongii TaxID=2662364 RepID=A0A5Q0QBT3_9SPHI|nr:MULTISPECIES: PA0069 family radical SAM protein [unclassified Sphingobacterium]MVZ67231.1 PA0069 family radical SAM protein [Sphingobacterium sp. DK4209]QGA26734.1 PA0069 family radical SAM protein [Sphingobacterium sp. dk4302]